jgi:hypothetical protein
VRQPQAGARRDAGRLAADSPENPHSNEEFYRLYRQALEDMAALRLPIGTDRIVFLPAADLPGSSRRLAETA